MPLKRTLIFAAACCLMLVGQASAGVILFNNFGPGNAYDPTVGLSIGYAPVNEVIAVPFTPSVDSALDSLLLPLTAEVQQTSGAVYIAVLRDDGSNLPCCTVLETFFYDSASLPPNDALPHPPLTLTSVLQPFLSSGTQYWVQVGAFNSSGVRVTWHLPLPHAVGPIWYSQYGVSQGVHIQDQPALQVNGTVPEPATLGSFIFGAFALCGLRVAKLRRSSQQKR